MADDNRERNLLVLMVLLALWLGAYGYSLFVVLNAASVASATLPDTAASAGFLGWQAIAGVIAFACWAVGRTFPGDTGIRRISGVPLGMALAVVIGLVAYALLTSG